MRFARKFLPAVLAAAVLASCEKPEQETIYDEYVLPLIETTDMHGHFVNIENGTVHYRLAYVADKVKDIRGHGEQYRKDRLLLLDGGDIYQGASVSNLLDGMPMYVSVDRMDYDAVALGNHEFDWGYENMVDPDATLLDYDWEGRREVNEVPVLCVNLFQNGSRASNTRDYVIVEKSAVNLKGDEVKVRIGVIGFAVDYGSGIMTSKFSGKGYSIEEDWSIANDIAEELESSGRCDATILLIHGAADDSAQSLGKGSPIDLVLGGHSHSVLSGSTSWGLPFLQGGRYCEYYASAKLKFRVHRGGEVTFKKADNLSVAFVDSNHDQHSYAGQNADNLDDDIIAVSDAALEATARQQNEVIGYISTGATTSYLSGSGDRATTMTNWMCDILRGIGEADVSFVNSGGVRTTFPLNGKPRRDITVADIYEMFPFGNATYVYSITYAELLQLLEYSLTGSGQSLFSFMTGINCCYTGASSPYTVQSLEKDGTIIYRDGEWTSGWASKNVVLAVSEFLATTQRVDGTAGLSNPLLEWNDSPRLLSRGLVDNENAVRVLREEAALSGGKLHVDTAPHFIQGGR